MHFLCCCVHLSGVPLGVKIKIQVFLKMNGESEQIISVLSSQLGTVMGVSLFHSCSFPFTACLLLSASQPHNVPFPSPLPHRSYLSHSDLAGVPASCPGCSWSEIRAGEATGTWPLNDGRHC